MRSHLRSMAKRKVSDFLLREEGMVGNRSAFATAALVSTASLAMTLLVAPSAEAAGCVPACNPDWGKCCSWIRNGTLVYGCRAQGGPCPPDDC